MKNRAFALTMALCGLLSASPAVIAAENESELLPASDTELVLEAQPEFLDSQSALTVDTILPNHPRIVVNGQLISTDTLATLVGDVTYVPYEPVIKALYPDAVLYTDNGSVRMVGTNLSFEIPASHQYVVVNGRYLYQPNGLTLIDGEVMFPVRTLCAWLGADVSWDGVNYCAVITANGMPLVSGDSYYNADDLYWLSHIINAESGNQSLAGKIAVGNVVLNRVASSQFPNTVKEVIYQKNQFSPVKNGSIKLEPNAESVIAAKLCLDGANTAGNALFFLNPKTAKSAWASRNRPYLTTIGAHAFYG